MRVVCFEGLSCEIGVPGYVRLPQFREMPCVQDSISRARGLGRPAGFKSVERRHSGSSIPIHDTTSTHVS